MLLFCHEGLYRTGALRERYVYRAVDDACPEHWAAEYVVATPAETIHQPYAALSKKWPSSAHIHKTC